MGKIVLCRQVECRSRMSYRDFKEAGDMDRLPAFGEIVRDPEGGSLRVIGHGWRGYDAYVFGAPVHA